MPFGYRHWSSLAVSLVCIVLGVTSQPVRGQTPVEFRGLWADVFHEGYKSTGEIDALVSRAVSGRYNAIVAEVLGYHDNNGAAHGAFWHTQIEGLPTAPCVNAGFDPLGYLVQQAHANGLEVHCWMVTYRVSASWPPSGNTIIQDHPEWIMTTQAGMGGGPSTIPDGTGANINLDIGSPDVQEYLVSIVRELLTNYAIDGIHWDYIRCTQTDAGYPASSSYANSGLARYRRIYGTTGTPSPSNSDWSDFRRRGITEHIRRMRAEIAATPSLRQPVRHSASLITWGNAPATFPQSSAWGVFQNWEEWMRLGYLDTGIPMTYYDEGSNPTYYRNWVNKEMVWRYQRQMVVGPGIYLNSFAESVTQMLYARNAGADGLCTYSYWATKASSANDWTWYTASNGSRSVFTSAATVPTMPWRNPATATEGTLWGCVTDAVTGAPIDDASVQVGTMSPVKTDGNGYYVVTLIPASGSGTNVTVVASKPPAPNSTHGAVQVVAGDIRRDDFSLGVVQQPQFDQQPVPRVICGGGSTTFSVIVSGAGTLAYQWQRNGADLANGGHYSGVTMPTLTVLNSDGGDTGNYRCVVHNEAGSADSDPALLTVRTATAFTLSPVAQAVCAGETTTFTVAATGDGAVTYQWQKNGANLDDGPHYFGVTTSVLTVLSAEDSDAGYYRCVATAGCGSANSMQVGLTVKAATTITQQPAAAAVYPGADAAFSVAATGSGTPTYQWQKDGVDLMEEGRYSGVTTPALRISKAAGADVGSYRCVITTDCGSLPSAAAALTLKTFLGDLDNDGDIDLEDFSQFRGCFNGPNQPSPSGCAVNADFDNDNDVDLSDFSIFRTCFNGPNRGPSAACPMP